MNIALRNKSSIDISPTRSHCVSRLASRVSTPSEPRTSRNRKGGMRSHPSALEHHAPWQGPWSVAPSQRGGVGEPYIPPRWAILLDFDYTSTENHSGGFTYDETWPMSKDNQEAFKRVVVDWLSSGHHVAVITRGIATKLSIYFTTILNMLHVMNDHRNGFLSIYAPDESTFNTDHDAAWWASQKVAFVSSMLDASRMSPNDALFIDDTKKNVKAMKRAFPSMICLHATAGEYAQSFSMIQDAIA